MGNYFLDIKYNFFNGKFNLNLCNYNSPTYNANNKIGGENLEHPFPFDTFFSHEGKLEFCWTWNDKKNYVSITFFYGNM